MERENERKSVAGKYSYVSSKKIYILSKEREESSAFFTSGATARSIEVKSFVCECVREHGVSLNWVPLGINISTAIRYAMIGGGVSRDGIK